jgi:hypothetical protein
MPRIAHSKRPGSLRRKHNRERLIKARILLKEKEIHIREVEQLTGIGVGQTTLMIQGKARMDQVTVMLIETIAKYPSTMRQIELMWQGHTIDEVAAIMVHES